MNKLNVKLATGLLLVFLGIGMTAEVSYAATNKNSAVSTSSLSLSLKENLTKATVNLYCRIKVGNKEVSSTGSGVVIDSRGVILTNAHVAQFFLLNGEDSRLKANCTVRTGSPAKDAYTAEVLYISSNWLTTNSQKSKEKTGIHTAENDFALLYITGAKKGSLPTTYHSLSLGTTASLSIGGEVLIAGYPSEDLNFKEIRNKLNLLSATATITKLSTFDNSQSTDTFSLSRTKLAKSGASGGPVVTKDMVLGIITMRSTSSNEDGASVRALTLSYIDRVLTSEVGLTLATILGGDLTRRIIETRENISKEELSAIEKTLRRLK